LLLGVYEQDEYRRYEARIGPSVSFRHLNIRSCAERRLLTHVGWCKDDDVWFLTAVLCGLSTHWTYKWRLQCV